MTKNRLERSDIVGQEIVAVLQSPHVIDKHPDGDILSCEVYVGLKNGIFFELVYELNHLVPISNTEKNNLALVPAKYFTQTEPCEGHRIVEVVLSRIWATVGLLLDDDRVIFVDAAGESVTAMVDYINPYDLGHYLFYWDGIRDSRDDDTEPNLVLGGTL